MNDGVDEPTGKGTSRVGASYAPRPGAQGVRTGAALAGSLQESALLKSLLGPALGVTADDVPDLGVSCLRCGGVPMARSRWGCGG